MWTPRQMALSLAALLFFMASYGVYAQFLGVLDGLPALPEKYLPDSKSSPITLPTVVPTVKKLQDAFGLGSVEATEDRLVYKTKVEFQKNGMVIAAGQLVFDPQGSRFVPVAPLSVAMYGSGKPASGEIADISTFHADKAVLEFSKPVSKMEDFNSEQVQLVGIELVSEPDGETDDPRKGYIWITNNQKSADPSKHIVARTTGPVFYRMQDETKPFDPEAPQIWTASEVEVFDRKNLPRPLHEEVPDDDPRRRYAVMEILNNRPPLTAVSRPEDLRRNTAIADILLGVALPPPSITATGLQIFLHDKRQQRTKPSKSKSEDASIRKLVLQQNVLMNLWNDGGSGFPGDDAKQNQKAAPDTDELPIAASALIGGLADGATLARRLESKSLMLIETLGSFIYDFEKEEARFTVAATPPPAGQANYVTLTRLNAQGGQDNLFCTHLILDVAQPVASNPDSSRAKNGESRTGRGIQGLTATGEYVYISVESEKLTAQGTELVYRKTPAGSRTTFTGQPVLADRDGNRLEAGDRLTRGTVIIESLAAKTPDSKTEQTVSVQGHGRMEMYDAEAPRDPKAAPTPSFWAKWGKALIHTKEKLGGKTVDLMKFEGSGSFVDPKGDFQMTADTLWLWLGARETKAASAEAKPNKSAAPGIVPERLVADQNVDVRSPELIIKETDRLTVWFRDIDPPAVVAAAPAAEANQPDPVAGATPQKPTPQQSPPAKADPPRLAIAPQDPPPPVGADQEPPPIPVLLSARVVESWVVRYPTVEAKSDQPRLKTPNKTGGKLKYELERAHCEDRVRVQQDPADPTKNVPGLDVTGNKLNLNHSPNGSVVRVFGTSQNFAMVQYEGLTLYGPEILIDQPNNYVDIDGVGRLKMLSDADLNGNSLEQPSDIVMTWSERMQFWGAKSRAEFSGMVNAQQIIQPVQSLQPGTPAKPLLRPVETAPVPKPLPSANPNTTYYLLQCHRMDMTFDKPIYFNQSAKSDKAKTDGKKQERPKLKAVTCTPIPDDEIKNASTLTPSKDVYFYEEVLKPNRTYAQARILVAKQIDFTNSEKEQDLKATGPGELRILQTGGDDGFGPDQNAKEPAAKKNEDEEPKLTIVTFRKRMHARDQAKIFQEAVFPDGANVVRLLTANPKLKVELHELPATASTLKCEESLVVSSSKPGNGAKAETRMVATGNAIFKDKAYSGAGGKITYTNQAIIFDGTPTRLATMYQNKIGVNERPYHQARQIVYKKDGSISVSGSGGGSLVPGG